MKVSQLISNLQKLPQEAEIKIYSCDSDQYEEPLISKDDLDPEQINSEGYCIVDVHSMAIYDMDKCIDINGDIEV